MTAFNVFGEDNIVLEVMSTFPWFILAIIFGSIMVKISWSRLFNMQVNLANLTWNVQFFSVILGYNILTYMICDKSVVGTSNPIELSEEAYILHTSRLYPMINTIIVTVVLTGISLMYVYDLKYRLKRVTIRDDALGDNLSSLRFITIYLTMFSIAIFICLTVAYSYTVNLHKRSVCKFDSASKAMFRFFIIIHQFICSFSVILFICLPKKISINDTMADLNSII